MQVHAGRLIHTPEVRQQGLPAQCPALRLFRRDPVLPPLFSIPSFPSATSSILWSGPTPIRDAASFGCPSFAAPGGDQPPDADGPHRFRYVPFGRDVSSAPGFTHEVPEVERYVCFGNCESSSALSGAAISKPRRVIAERAQLPERSDA